MIFELLRNLNESDNIDVAFFKDLKRWGVSMCLRDEGGNFRGARTISKDGLPMVHEETSRFATSEDKLLMAQLGL